MLVAAKELTTSKKLNSATQRASVGSASGWGSDLRRRQDHSERSLQATLCERTEVRASTSACDSCVQNYRTIPHAQACLLGRRPNSEPPTMKAIVAFAAILDLLDLGDCFPRNRKRSSAEQQLCFRYAYIRCQAKSFYGQNWNTATRTRTKNQGPTKAITNHSGIGSPPSHYATSEVPVDERNATKRPSRLPNTEKEIEASHAVREWSMMHSSQSTE